MHLFIHRPESRRRRTPQLKVSISVFHLVNTGRDFCANLSQAVICQVSNVPVSSLPSSAQCRVCVSIAEHSHLALGIGKAHPGRIDRIVDGDAQIAMNLLRIGVLRPDA